MEMALPIRAALLCGLTLAGSVPALAAQETAQVARMCRQLAMEAHPTAKPGLERDIAQAQREYFQDCVAQMQQDRLLLTGEERSLILRNVPRRGGSTLALGALSEGAEVPRGVALMDFPK